MILKKFNGLAIKIIILRTMISPSAREHGLVIGTCPYHVSTQMKG